MSHAARWITIASGIAVALLALAAANRAVAGLDLGGKIEAAKTAAEHEAIAAEFEEEAKSLDERAARHRELAKHYGHNLSFAHNRKLELAAHCEKITASLTQAAEEARLLAGEHRAIAAELGK